MLFSGVVALALTTCLAFAQQPVGQAEGVNAMSGATMGGHPGHPGPEGCAGHGLGMPAPSCALPMMSEDMHPQTICYLPALKTFVIIDSIDCAVDLVRRVPVIAGEGQCPHDTVVRVGRYVTDVYKGRHDLKKILRPQSVLVAAGRIVLLASSQDSSFVAVLGMDACGDTLPLLGKVGLNCKAQCMRITPCGREITVVGTNPSGYDISIIAMPEGLDAIGAARVTRHHYHVPKQSERIQASDPVGVGLTFVAVIVVFFVLMCIALILKFYGKAIQNVQKKKAMKAAAADAAPVQTAVAASDVSGEVYAAIAAAIYLYDEEMHDEENTIITIQKVERAWTPWNAKYYNMNKYFNNK
ncbi:MAG: OadG family protein [Bacteroidales bacterium]|nr:OadG family protein [Bacteroidales bacterium]